MTKIKVLMFKHNEAMLNILYHQNGIIVAQTLANFNDHNAPYGGFNLGLHTGDDALSVLHNRAKLLAELNVLTNHQIYAIHWLNQIHSELVVAPTAPTLTPKNADAWSSVLKNEGLAIMTADCVPIVLFGKKGGMACIHAGWQGLVKGVIKNAFQTLPKDEYQAMIGACISGYNYEIDHLLGEQIIAQCLDLVDVDEDELRSMILLPHEKTDKCYLDVGQLTKLQLLSLGISDMTDCVPCSYEGTKQGQYYSHRYATHFRWQSTGRMAMIVAKY